MTNEEILSGLSEVILTIKPKTDPTAIKMDASLIADLGIDSLSMMLMSLAVEQKFNFQFKTFEPFKTIGEVVEYIAGEKN